MTTHHLVVFFSPAGTTEVVARRIVKELERQDQQVVLQDLADDDSFSAGENSLCLWLGTPVYFDHALPLIHDFIKNLPKKKHCFSVPFVTWGGVTSGLALPEMAQQLNERGYKPLGAAKILAQHSSLWFSERPLAAHHPMEGDLQQVDELVKIVVKGLQPEAKGLDLSKLDYLSAMLKEEAQKKCLSKAKVLTPLRQVDPSLCVGCGLCVDLCPVRAITLKKVPQISSACILCLQCVRHCPKQAFVFNEKQTEERLAVMAQISDEEKKTEIFF